MSDRAVPNSKALPIATGVYLAVWLAAAVTWKFLERAGQGSFAEVLPWVYWSVFGLSLPVGIVWLALAFRSSEIVFRRAVFSAVFIMWWQLAVFALNALRWEALRSWLAFWGTLVVFLVGLAWVIWGLERIDRRRERPDNSSRPDLSGDVTTLLLWGLLLPPGLFVWGARRARPVRWVALVGGFLWLWMALTAIVPCFHTAQFWIETVPLAWITAAAAVSLAPLLTAPFLVELLAKATAGAPPIWWVIITSLLVVIALRTLVIAIVATLAVAVWWRFRRVRAHLRQRMESDSDAGLVELDPLPATLPGFFAISNWWRRTPHEPEFIWNPLNPDAWFYGRRSRKLNQSLTALLSYSFVFFMGHLVLTQVGGCQETYELPAGGGEAQPLAQTVKIQKKIRKKFVVNPLSALKFKVPPIDEVQLQLQEVTKHAYTVGYGQGQGAGFAGGTNKGKVRFIRLEYTGGDWDQDFGVGADLNMLIEYGTRTGQKIANETESRRVGELANFPIGKAPPMVYLTGQKNVSLSKSEIKTLREYLLDKHGMLFIDNGGSRHFHNQIVYMMHQILPNVQEVPIPLDDVIHRIPYTIPFLPYVAPHGGREALGWKVDGRWVCYYHPGDVADAWADDHAGVKPEIWEACYRLGTNVIFYAHAEYSKWLASRQQSE